VAVRVFDNFAGGGFSGPASNLCVSVKGGATTIPLSGPWKYTVEYALREMPNLCGNWSFGNLFNGMIHPLLDFPVKGVIWYQGESNTERVDDYPVLLGSMIKSWRAGWKQGDLPFYQVQLAGFMPAPKDPEDTAWARLREAQVTTAREVPNCGIVTALDLGDAKDIHPANKQEVGRRLALAALKNTYGKDLVASGPVYDAYSVEEDKVRITFKETGGGLMAKGGSPLKQFTVAGPDRTFVWAQARVAGDSVVVWSAHVPKPVAVRYAWANNPEGANLCNQEGLPAFPFRTDRWPATPAQSSPQP
jgi:sialate O-acetylesterase